MIINQQFFVFIILISIAYLVYTCFNETEYFVDNNNISNANANNANANNVNTNNTNATEANPIRIIEYNTEDGGVTVKWTRPEGSVDYMALIKDEEGDEEVKLFFKDTISAECQDETCQYSFQNLMNGRKYSLVMSTVHQSGISDFSNKIEFVPTYQTMKCNVNGICNVIESDKTPTLNTKIDSIMTDTDATKEILAKFQGMLNSETAMYDINQIYEADGGFKHVKDKLQYPEHLLLPIKKGPNSLKELVKHQLDLGIINVNVHNKTIADEIKQEKKKGIDNTLSSMLTTDSNIDTSTF